MRRRRPKKKRNHYVPQLVLRNFSADGRTIAILLLSNGRRIAGASLRDQCYEDYFYGKSPEVEDRFAAHEARIAAILRPLNLDRLERLNADELADIRAFVFEQRQRTLAAATANLLSNAAMMDYAIEVGFAVSDQDRRLFQEEQRAPQRFMIDTMASHAPLISDLEVKFLIPSLTSHRNKTRPPGALVISDAAVACYNQWAEHHPKFSSYSGYTGIASKGLQWFYPFAPDLCICVYDPTVYLYGSPRSRVCRPGSRDVLLLNTLQALHAHECLYYVPSLITDQHLGELRDASSSEPSLRTPLRHDGPERFRDDGTTSQIIGWRRRDPRLNAQFQFVRVTDMSPYQGYDRVTLPLRAPELYERVTQQNA
jgi:hypothetical protein